MPGHHLTDQLVGLQLAGLVFGWQHGGLWWRRDVHSELQTHLTSIARQVVDKPNDKF